MFKPSSGDTNIWAAVTRAARAAWFGADSTVSAQAPLVLNNENVLAVNAAGSGTVGLIKADGSDVVTVGNGAVIATPGTGTGAIVTTTGTQTLTNKTLAENQLRTATITISAAQMVGTAAGELGHAAGVVLVADPGAGKVVELISAVLSFTYSTAQYTGGGNITVNINGGAALTGLISHGNSVGAAADKIVQFVPLSTAGNALTVNKGLNLVAAAAPTQPGTAAGTAKVFVTYRVHTL